MDSHLRRFIFRISYRVVAKRVSEFFKTPPSIIHFTLEIEKKDYEKWKKLLIHNNVTIESVLSWGNNSKSIYFHDPVGNLVEFITKGSWPVDD